MLNNREDGCFFCGRTDRLELHHIFPGRSGRKLSTEDDFTVWLCHTHHNTPEGVHYRIQMRRYLQAIAQKQYEETHSHEEWMQRYGRNYL